LSVEANEDELAALSRLVHWRYQIRLQNQVILTVRSSDQSFAALFLSADGAGSNNYVKTSSAFDQSHGIYYYAKPEELAARAFEHMLQQQSLKNSFLVSGTLKSQAAKAGLYPDAALSSVLAQHWLGYFSLLGRALS
jgi:hypothetical protein